MRLLLSLSLLLLLLLAAPAAAEERAYGWVPRQRLDYTPAARRDAPLVVFIHVVPGARGQARGGAHGDAFSRARLCLCRVQLPPRARRSVREQAADVAAAIAALRRDTGLRQLLLMGHSAGPISLLGRHRSLLSRRAAPDARRDDGVVLLDGAGYDVARQIEAAGPLLGACTATLSATTKRCTRCFHRSATRGRKCGRVPDPPCRRPHRFARAVGGAGRGFASRRYPATVAATMTATPHLPAVRHLRHRATALVHAFAAVCWRSGDDRLHRRRLDRADQLRLHPEQIAALARGTMPACLIWRCSIRCLMGRIG